MKRRLARAGLWGTEQKAEYPVVIKNGLNRYKNPVHFYFNYSMEPRRQEYLHGKGLELLSHRPVAEGETLLLEPWGFRIIEEEA